MRIAKNHAQLMALADALVPVAGLSGAAQHRMRATRSAASSPRLHATPPHYTT